MNLPDLSNSLHNPFTFLLDWPKCYLQRYACIISFDTVQLLVYFDFTSLYLL